MDSLEAVQQCLAAVTGPALAGPPPRHARGALTRPAGRSVYLEAAGQIMSRKRKAQEEVFAILRWDGFHDPEAPPDVLATVKEVVRSRELAEAEVARLNARLFPEGSSAGPDVS